MNLKKKQLQRDQTPSVGRGLGGKDGNQANCKGCSKGKFFKGEVLGEASLKDYDLRGVFVTSCEVPTQPL